MWVKIQKKLMMSLLEIPITSAADIFVWGFVILLAFVGAISIVDVMKETKNEPVEPRDKPLR